MSTDFRIVNVGFVAYGDGSPARYASAVGTVTEMLIVTCDVRSGRTPEVLERFGRAVTALCADAYGISKLQVAIYVTEHAAHEIYRDGARAPDWSASERDNAGPRWFRAGRSPGRCLRPAGEGDPSGAFPT